MDINFQPLRHEYSKELQDDAESFIKKCFTDNKLSTGVHPTLVEVAMNIINGHSFYQPIASGKVQAIEIEGSIDSVGTNVDLEDIE